MQMFATGLLAAMAVLFLLIGMLHSKAAWVGWAKAFTEAALVGACADWFAVTALFRRPFGLPIPHTAIIPRNKDRIGRGVGRFIAENFLAPEVLEERLERLDAAGILVELLKDPSRTRALARRIAPIAAELLSAFTEESAGAVIGHAARRGLDAVPAAPVAGRMLGALRKDGGTETLYNESLAFAAGWVESNEPLIRRKVEESTAKWMPGWVDRMLGDKVMAALFSTLKEARAPGHPWRAGWDGKLAEWAQKLEHDPELRAQGEALKARLLDSPEVHEEARGAWRALHARWSSRPAALARGLDELLAALGRRLANDEAARDALNRWIRGLVLKTTAPRAGEIARFVTEVVERWDAQTIVERIELQVGRDLQYIRINGTIVGGLVGVVVHAASLVI